MQTEKHLVTLDSATGTYLTGTTIHGSIQLLATDKGKKIRGVSFRIYGRGRCGWTAAKQPQRSPVQQSLPNDEATAAALPFRSFGGLQTATAGTAAEAAARAVESKSTELALQYSGREVFLDETVFLVGTKTAPSFTVRPDNSTFEFAYALPVHLPSSFRGQYGKVKYTIEFTVHQAWRFDETVSVPLTVRHALDLNAIEQQSALLPYQHQQTRVVGLLNSGPVSLHVYAPRCGCATGDRLPIQVIVSNRSNTHVEKVKFTLIQLIEYHSTQPARFMRSESVRVMRKEAGGVDKKSEQRYEHTLEMPNELPATRIGTGIINIRYEIRVEAKLSGWSRNLIETVPFVVASLPYFSGADETTPTATATAAPPSGANDAGPAAAIGWQPSMSSSLNGTTHSDQSTPTPSAYPSMQSLPNPPAMHATSSPYSPYSPQPAYNHYHQMPPNYAQSTATTAGGHLQRGSVGSAAMAHGHASAPPLDFVTPTGSTRSSICSSVLSAAPSMPWHGVAPPSYEQMYGTSATASVSSSEASSASSSPFADAGRLRRKQAPMYPA